MAISGKTNAKLGQLQELKEQAKLGGGPRRIEQQHAKGKLTARERIHLLLDEGSFQELDTFLTHRAGGDGQADQQFLGEAVVTGYGNVNGRLVYVFSQDFTVSGGSLSEAVGQKICKVLDLAMKTGAPIVGLNDSGGARIQEGVLSLAGYGEIFLRNTLASGAIPQISVIMGPAAGGAVYSPALTDFVFMVKGIGQMYITGPDVVKAATGEDVTHEQLGGAMAHSVKSGVAHFALDTEEQCLDQVRRLLSFLPENNMEDPPLFTSADPPNRICEPLQDIIPESPNQPYDVKDIITTMVDHSDFLEVHQHYAPNLVVGFGRLNGKPVGVVANQPMFMAGVLDIDASMKGARFVRFCDAFNIPLITLVDVPGFMPGTQQEHGGIIKHGAKLIYAYAEATVPKISVITRKAYGGSYLVMSSKHLRSDIDYAWPTAEIAVMGADAAVNVISREAIAKSSDPEETQRQLTTEHEEKFNNPYVAASRGYIDEVIDPGETRSKVISALEMLAGKRDTLPPKKHGNIPL